MYCMRYLEAEVLPDPLSPIEYHIADYFEMMKILFVDNCSQETCLADVSIRCSNPPQGEI